MKKIFLCLFLFVCIFSHAQKLNLTGKVVNANNKALAGVTLRVLENNQGTVTDFEGNYQLRLEKGNYTLQATYIGYETVTKQVSLNTHINVSFLLNTSSTVLEEVLVSAVRANKNTPVTFTNISKKELEKRNLGQDIPILLKYTPSVVSSSDAGAGVGYTYMNIRGSNGERINVTVNGIPYNDAESHGSFWVNLGDFASSTQNLQIQRGVGTSTNGSGAFGASVNILTDAVSDKAYAEVANSVGSYGTRKHTLKFSTGKLNDHIEVAGRLSKINSDGYVDRAFTDIKSYYLQASYTDDKRLIKAIAFGGKEHTYQAWYGLTKEQLKEDRRQNPYTYDNEVDDYKQNHYQFHWNEKLTNQWSTNVALNYTKGAGFFEQYKAEETAADFNNLIVDNSDVIVRRWLDNDFYVANFNVNYKTKQLNFISGLSYSNYMGDHFGEVIWGSDLAENTNIRDRYYFSDATKNDFSVFAKATFSLTEQLSAYADLQGRFVNYKTKGITSDIDPIDVNTNFNFFNPKFGFTYEVNKQNSIYTSFAVANREPNRNDFESGVNTHETLHDYELGWRANGKVIDINSNIYFMDYKNQLVLTGAVDGVGAPIRATSGKSYRLGLEIDANIKVSKQFFIKPNVSFSRNKNVDFVSEVNGNLENLGNTNLSYSPDVIVGNAIVYQPIKNLQVSFLSKYVGKQYLNNIDDENSTLSDYTVSDLNFSYELKPKKLFKSIMFNGLINNIFNKKYVANAIDYGGGYIYYFPQATRNFLVGVTLKF